MTSELTDRRSRLVPILFAIFTLSGFAGLIYESIWSHYLKLFLGHAAYAQSLVLMIFMGGMAIGAYLAGRYSDRITRPLMTYAAIEALLGLAALGFDPTFSTLSVLVFDTAAPALGVGWAIDGLKWGLSAAMILPQSVLLGATFPLISAGVIRLLPAQPGSVLGWLYFTNSLGAAIGVLVAGFVLIAVVGLPGTILTAGLINLFLALVVYLLVRNGEERAGLIEVATSGSANHDSNGWLRLLLMTAFITGAASFCYEIGWIRMLSLVLGSATHSFELMLSAFILGLSLGAWWIRRRIDSLQAPLQTLAWIQVVMAVLAWLTVWVYSGIFEAMAGFMSAVARTEQGYVLFNLFSHALCIALMLPTTVCAGMTLPLITKLLLRTGSGERSIGFVYAANTLGAITGVIMAVHLLMPLMGLRQVILIGGALDVTLGLYLLHRSGALRQFRPALAAAAAVCAGITIALAVHWDPRQLASGVFRFGDSRAEGEVTYHRDGKTASVAVIRHDGGRQIAILTNGKSDASLAINAPSSADDPTMILMGALPLLMHPEPRTAAVIGMGSGRSTHTLLTDPRLERVDTIEIERAMVEGAKLFGSLTERTFTDPRSHIHIEDAKAYFSGTAQHYDLIVSEPSNPWVSGVASLFSEEFYSIVRRQLAEGGLFVQWIQLYEINDQLTASILKAMLRHFPYVRAFSPNSSDLLLVAAPDGPIPAPGAYDKLTQELKDLLTGIDLPYASGLRLREVADQRLLAAYAAAPEIPPNSDYFPIVDQRAVAHRFLQNRAGGLLDLHTLHHPLFGSTPDLNELVPMRHQGPAAVALLGDQARQLKNYLSFRAGDGAPPNTGMDKGLLNQLTLLLGAMASCDPVVVGEVWEPTYSRLLRTVGYLLDEEAGLLLQHVAFASSCPWSETVGQRLKLWADLTTALTRRNDRATARLSLELIGDAPDNQQWRSSDDLRWLAALSLTRLGEAPAALEVLAEAQAESQSQTVTRFDPRSVLTRMLVDAGQQ